MGLRLWQSPSALKPSKPPKNQNLSTSHRPADWAHVVPRENADLAGVHGGALEPAVLTALQHQKHLALPQLQLVLLAGGVGEHGHIATAAKQTHQRRTSVEANTGSLPFLTARTLRDRCLPLNPGDTEFVGSQPARSHSWDAVGTKSQGDV